MIRQDIVLAILTWKQSFVSRSTSPSGTCMKESDPHFRLIPSRYMASLEGAPCETAVIVAMDSGRIISYCLAIMFHWMCFFLEEDFVVGWGLIVVAGVEVGAQLAVKASLGTEPCTSRMQ
jgi:hypothetical protein